MRQKQSRTTLLKNCLALSLGLFVCSWPTLTLAQSQQPSTTVKRRLPGRRVGAGTRGPCTNPKQPLVALIPDTNLGLTAEKYPTFFWFIPPTPARTAEFVLNNEKKQEIYKTTFAITGSPGVINVTLPANATLPPLEVNKNYSWTFSLICNPSDPSAVDFVQGWVQRVALSRDVGNQLTKAAPRDRPAIYAKEGIWNDTLKSLSELRRDNPRDRALTTDWETLLKSVGLDTVAKAPLVQCCSQTNRASGDTRSTSSNSRPSTSSSTR
ncbi:MULTISPECIES: DUF928 domain-containing protein [Trichocoleus]|uniref:DUF928 domain-containing protein n=1 Tax=Trichocoleus desertorum GB2-A4 TaxID=2933944 RepID=A0ABV0J4Q4_9CYAN|nr:DUF928 domain-containing protein [Trichocoleus sp. FACHB-46]MBD1860745.1 DUF928 domain-containing protein [Trichocoleus sp. FACHB-46]